MTADPVLQGQATIERLCGLARVSRAGYYRSLEASVPRRADAELRDLIQKIAIAKRRYGHRRVTAELRRQGIPANRKRVLRLMREDNLLCLPAKPFVPRTTDSGHGFRIVPNLVRGVEPSGLDQIWVADITYIRLLEEFVYLAILLDAYSRRAIGWALEDHLEARLAVAALDMAIAARRPVPGSLIHHSDRGVQYACGEYGARLAAYGIRASMSGPDNPYDNAKAESFIKTLKAEEVYAASYANLDEARRDISRFLAEVYNADRLHSALGYKPPLEFETEIRQRHPNP
jgi:transposase InsO family protein